MKTPIKLVLAVVAVACCAAVSSINKPATPYNPEQVRGNVRVVLLRVDRSTVFSDEGVMNPAQPQKILAIPGVSIVYVVELLGNEPVKHWNTVETGKLAYVSGKQVNSMPDLAGGGYGGWHEFERYDWKALKQPAVTNPKRTHVFERFERGVRVPTGKVDLHFTAGFNDQNEEFVFENVPVE